VQVPTGGIARERLSAPNFLGSKGQQIRCNSGADGIVRMKESVMDLAPFGPGLRISP
jgi:hypothetical protein